MKKKTNYVNNEALIDEIKKYRSTNEISHELHIMFYEMAKRIARKGNWIGYTWNLDMITEAYLSCISALDKIDIERKSLNAFSYFTTVIHYRMIDFIKYEHKQRDIKQRNLDNYYDSLLEEFDIVDTRNKIYNQKHV